METWGKSSFTLYIKERIKIIKRFQLRYSQLNNACLEVYGACRHILRFHRFIRNWWSLYRLKSWFFKFSRKRSARNQCPLGHYGKISRYVLNTYVEKHTVTYAYFHVQTNKICTIVSTEVPPYPRTSTGTICTLRVVQFFSWGMNCPGGLSWEIFPGTTSRGGKYPPMKKSTPTRKLLMENLPRRNFLTIIPTPSGIIWPFHHFTIGENGKSTIQNRSYTSRYQIKHRRSAP